MSLVVMLSYAWANYKSMSGCGAAIISGGILTGAPSCCTSASVLPYPSTIVCWVTVGYTFDALGDVTQELRKVDAKSRVEMICHSESDNESIMTFNASHIVVPVDFAVGVLRDKVPIISILLPQEVLTSMLKLLKCMYRGIDRDAFQTSRRGKADGAQERDVHHSSEGARAFC